MFEYSRDWLFLFFFSFLYTSHVVEGRLLLRQEWCHIRLIIIVHAGLWSRHKWPVEQLIQILGVAQNAIRCLKYIFDAFENVFIVACTRRIGQIERFCVEWTNKQTKFGHEYQMHCHNRNNVAK